MSRVSPAATVLRVAGSVKGAVWPDYDAYQASTDRQIPLFVLDPAS